MKISQLHIYIYEKFCQMRKEEENYREKEQEKKSNQKNILYN